MASIIARGGRLYAKIRNIDGKPERYRTDFIVGQEAAAERWANEQEERIANAREFKPAGTSGPLTIALYARAWLDKRKTKTVADDRGRLEKHVIPRIGDVVVKDARPRHFRDLIMGLRNETDLAPKTIREISGLCHTLFNSAVIDEIVTENPVKYEKGVLPKKLDKDPSWRRQAIYTRAEVEQMLSDERIPIDRRVLYALKFFTGRHSEVSGLTWEQWDPATKPLGSLAVDKTKTDVPRMIPVHPTLAKVLASWKLFGWEDLYGHHPKPLDLIIPTRNLTRRDANESQRQLKADLELVGLRVKAGKARFRRGHDLRRTLITLARADGAIDSLLRWITHGPKPSEILDVYSSPPWESLCTEIGKLKIELLEGKVIAMAANDPMRPQMSAPASQTNRGLSVASMLMHARNEARQREPGVRNTRLAWDDPRLPQSFWQRCTPEPDSGCWLWTGRLSSEGYGRIWGHGAHCVALEIVETPPDGTEVDHKCSNTNCVNPDHLEWVTQAQNAERAWSRRQIPDGTARSKKGPSVQRAAIKNEEWRPRRDSNHLSLVSGDTPCEETRDVGGAELSPDGTDSDGLDLSGSNALKSRCDAGLAMMRASSIRPLP